MLCISITGACLVGKWNYKFSYILFSINNKPNYFWLDYGHSLLIFLLSTQIWLGPTGHIWGFRTFLGECMEGMVWRLNSGHPLLFSSFWCHSDLVEQVKLGISGHFLEKPHWENGLKFLHADGSWPPTELIKLWSRFIDFLFWCHFNVVKRVKFWISGHFRVQAWRGWLGTFACCCILTNNRTD